MKTLKNIKFLLNQGFTLIELMIGVAIIAILSAIAIPAYNGYIETARIGECSNELQAISLAQKQFFLENNSFFPSPDATVTTVGAATAYIPLEAASGGYFRSTYREHQPIGSAAHIAHVNCDFTITTPDPILGGISYSVTVTAVPGRALAGGSSSTVAALAGLNRSVN